MHETKHIPVLLQETLEALALHRGATVVDATFGGGGHAQRMLQAVGKEGRLIGIDRDPQAIARFQEHNEMVPNLTLVEGSFSDLTVILDRLGIEKVDAVLADLGFSSDQIEDAERGMAFSQEGPLDMRFDQSVGRTARELLATTSQEELQQILVEYGEEQDAKRITRGLVERRVEQPFETTSDLAEFLRTLLPRRTGKNIHPATKTFQALRIAVNQEKEHLLRFLESAVDALRPGGRLAVITFHSGEDRLVKRFFKERATACVCPREFPVCQCGHTPTLRNITSKPITPRADEVENNPRARSAKLRVAEKVSSS
jgi:16S rRNA (cytosine1402-N4)-methyltransferase